MKAFSVSPQFFLMRLILLTEYIYCRSVGKEAADNIYGEAPKFHPLGRLGTVEEAAKAIMFLASDDCSWTTGHRFMLDGGRRLKTAG